MRFKIFVVGAFGGAAPTLLRLAMDLTSHVVSIRTIDLSYLLGVLILAFLGGGIAAVWNETDLKKVLYIGFGLPSLITVVTLNGTKAGPIRAKLEIPGTEAVLAQGQALPNRIVTFFVPSEAAGSDLTAHFNIPGKPEVEVPVKPSAYISVPDYATSVSLISSLAESGSLSLPSSPGAAGTVELHAEKRSVNGLLYALGVHTRPYSLVEDLARPGLARVKHLVVVMMEGRSFDHMLGGLKARAPYVEGLTGNETNPDTTGALVPVSPLAEYQGQFGVDPDTSFAGVDLQLFNGTQSDHRIPNMHGFIRSYFQRQQDVGHSHKIMNYFLPDKLPVLSSLAQRYAVCDHWFSSVPGPTFPNRAFTYAATSLGRVDMSLAGYETKTIFELLDENRISSRIYYNDTTLAGLFPKFRAKLDYFSADLQRFLDDCKNNSLPAYSFIEPNYNNIQAGEFLKQASDEHIDHNVFFGEAFITLVYNAIRSNPRLWESTILVIVYSQHGGLYDHVPPPPTVNPDGKIAISPPFDFTRLGVRVPAVIISPYIEAGTIERTVYDHTSIIATARKLFLGPGWNEKYLTQRDKQANTFEHLLTRRTPRTD